MSFPSDEQIMTFRIDFVTYLREKVEELKKPGEGAAWGDKEDYSDGWNAALNEVLELLK